jgi:hypothetical protein
MIMEFGRPHRNRTAMIEDSLIVPEPNTAMNPTIRIIIYAMTTIINFAFVFGFCMDLLNLQFEESYY